MNRRSFLQRLWKSALSVIGLSGSTYYYAKYIEPNRLSIQQETISSIKIPQSFHNVTILQFSDIHIGFHYTMQQFAQLIKTIQLQQPDLLLFTGDLFDVPNTVSVVELQQASQLLATVQAPLGKYWIYGNHDHGGYGTDIIAHYMEIGGFQLLQNEHQYIEKNGQCICLAGIDDVILGQPDGKRALQHSDRNLFTIMMCHEPDYAEEMKELPIDIQLSGHSHGGQIQLPFIGHLITPPYAQQYVEGWYNVPNSSSYLYVSRGIGTTRLPYRLLCMPEFTIHTLQSKSK
ncbi:metallophosphoesterase [Pontibacillus litoralis JSM 072002]|uniref:Metallophosphoesterase n=1 Tax=Pontibacillus litoralis JSM 072002 TaxID=1385512 RepID=A0A0A5HYX5_9BACI|nr:metallophosphoesterase [Pontibacillus litoralis JSM 072002]